MNIKNTKALLNHIEEHGPEHVAMDAWFQDGGGSTDGFCTSFKRLKHFDINQCGSTACAAGHGALVMYKQGITCRDYYCVADWLEIPSAERDMQGDPWLFYRSDWWKFGVLGRTALDIAYEKGDYYGLVHLLRGLIEREQKKVNHASN